MLAGMWAALPGGTTSTTYATVTADPDGVSPGNVFKFQSNFNETQGLRRVLPSGSQATVGVASRWWLSELPDNHDRSACLEFRDSTNAIQCSIMVETTGIIAAYRGQPNYGTLLGRTSVPVITAAAWSHIEVKAVIDDAAGAIEVRVNELSVLDLSSIDTKNTANAGCAQIEFSDNTQGGAGETPDFYLKDAVCWNASGSYNNDFMGDVQVVTLTPDADVSFNWDASTGTTGFNLIDESIPDDADYISADATPPAASVFGLSDLDPDVVTVKALMPVMRALKTDGGTANVQMSMRSDASDDAGTNHPITVAATYWFDISEEDPDTSTAWTPVSVDAAQLVINRTA